MKTFIRKLILFSLTFVLVLSGCSNGCGKQKEGLDENDEFVLEETGEFLVKNGEAEYKIVIPTVDVDAEFAANEFNVIFQKSSGFKLEVIKDTGLTFNNESKYVSIGRTSIAEQASICPDIDTYSQQKLKVKTQGNSVFLIGGGQRGLLYAVYEFLKYTINFDMIAPDETYVDVKNEIPLYKFDLEDEPDIKWRSSTYGPAVYDSTAATRMRFTNATFITGGYPSIHNSFVAFLPTGKYYEEHKTWYSTTYDVNGNKVDNNGIPFQLCYTAGGNSNDVEQMQAIVLDKLKEYISESYDRGERLETISFTMEDNTQWCACNKCKELKEKYGTNVASVIQFINPVAVQLKNWLSTAYPSAKVNIMIFAYLAAKEAPVKTLEDGTYQAIDETVIPEENVSVCYAPIFADFLNDFTSTENKTYYEEMKKWSAITESMYFWFYSTNFGNYFSWFDTFNSMQTNYQIAKELGAVWMFDQGRHNARSLTAFDGLKLYLSSKLLWDVDADVVSLTDNYFDKYFKNAAGPMKEYFSSFRTWSEYLKTHVGVSSDVGNDHSTPAHYPKQVLINWQNYINKAYDAIEMYKVDTELYNDLYDRITKESMAIRYYLIDFYAKTYSADEEYEMKKSFKADAIKYGYDRISELVLIDTVYKKWNI